jgi:hypothetical protein
MIKLLFVIILMLDPFLTWSTLVSLLTLTWIIGKRMFLEPHEL